MTDTPPEEPAEDIGFTDDELGLESWTDEAKEAWNKLTYKQRCFALHYVGSAKGNATEAAHLAGYSGTRKALAVMGCVTLRNINVRAALDALMNPLVMSETEIMWRISQDATATIGPAIDLSDPLRPTVDLNKLDEMGMLHLVKKVKTTTLIKRDEDGEAIEVLKVEVEMVDAQVAKRDLARIRGMFKDNLNLSGEVKVSGEQLDKAAKKGKKRSEKWRERRAKAKAEAAKDG